MTDLTSNESEQSVSAETNSSDERDIWPSPGHTMKNLREELGYSREKISESLYITVHYVKALENDNYSKLPGPTFIKGYYKAYADFLGADTDYVLTCYQNFVDNAINHEQQEAQLVETSNRKKTIRWVLVILVLVSLFVVAFLLNNDANALPVFFDTE